MANTIDFNVSTNAVNVLNQTAEASNNAKKELNELQKQMLSMDANSIEFQKAAARAGELKDQMNKAANAVRTNTGPAIEGLKTSFGLMGEQMRNLDFGGLSQSISSFGANLKKLKPEDVTNGFKDMLNAGKNAIQGLLQLVVKNPLLGLAGALVGVIAYWKELNLLINSTDISKLEKQKKILQDDARILETQLAVEKAKGISIENAYNQESAILRKKIQIADEEIKLANLKGDTDAITEAIKNKEQGIYDLKVLQAQLEGKINAGVEEAKRTNDEAYGLQQKKNESAKVELDAIESIKTKNKEDIEIAKEKALQLGLMNIFYSKQSFKIDDINDAKAQGLITERQVNQWINDEYKARESVENNLRKNAGDRISSGNAEIEQIKQVLAGRSSELKGLFQSAQTKMDAIKSEEELAKIEEEKRKKAEQDAEAKRKREERLAKIEEAKKKLAEDVLSIEKEMQEFKRRGMSTIELELFQAEEKYKVQVETFTRAKKSKEELEQLELLHQQHIQEILKKGDDEAYAIDEAKRQKELARVEEQFQLLQQLTSTAKENEINDAVLASEKLQELAVGNLDLETAIQEELKAKIAEINKKYADEEQALRDKKADDIKKKDADERKLAIDNANAKLEIAQQGLTALTALGDAYFSSQLANVQAGSKAELDLKKKQFAFNKKMQIGGAIMDTAKAITAAIAANPFPSPTLPVSIALASITGAAQIAKIASTKFDGGGGSSSGVNIPTTGGDGTTAPSPANYDFISQQPNQQPPLQAYVVGSQVSSNLEAQQLIQNQSRLGG